MLRLAVDCGGTKTLGILYDESFRPLKRIRTGSCRDNSTPPGEVCRHAAELAEGLFGSDHPELALLTGNPYPAVLQALREHCLIRDCVPAGELDASLSAARLFENGLLAISGTGATMFGRVDGKTYAAGGYGFAIEDAGGGYWLGRQALQAAIRCAENRGPETLLRELVCRKYGREDLREAVFTIYRGPNVTPGTVAGSVAACAPLLETAADAGDRVAADVLSRAGSVLALQMDAFCRTNGFAPNVPVTITGSVWKGHPLVLRTFRAELAERQPGRPIVIPQWDAIVGSVILDKYRQTGVFTAEDAKTFETLYREDRFILRGDQ